MILAIEEKRARQKLATARYRLRYPERVKEAKRKYLDTYATSPERAAYAANWSRQKRYGVTPQQWAVMKLTGCEICGIKEGKLCIDHDHVTGVIRGVLCHSCNSSIGHFRDNPELLRKAAIYLEERKNVVGN